MWICMYIYIRLYIYTHTYCKLERCICRFPSTERERERREEKSSLICDRNLASHKLLTPSSNRTDPMKCSLRSLRSLPPADLGHILTLRKLICLPCPNKQFLGGVQRLQILTNNILVGGVNPSEKSYIVSWDDYYQYMGK